MPATGDGNLALLPQSPVTVASSATPTALAATPSPAATLAPASPGPKPSPSASANAAGSSSSGGGGSSGSGGAGPVAPAPAQWTGRVLESLATGVGQPLAGAHVEVRDLWGSTSATAGSDGTFSVPVHGTSAQVVVSKPGYVPSSLANWHTQSGLDLHLQAASVPNASDPVAVTITGRVLDAQGAPVADALISGGDALGARFGPFQTGADGRYSGTGQAMAALDAAGVTVWAYVSGDTPAGPVAVGHARRAAVNGDLGDVSLSAPSGTVTLEPAYLPNGHRTATVAFTDPAGVSLVTASWDTHDARPLVANTFTLPDATQQGHLQIADDQGGASSWTGAADANSTATPTLLDIPATVPTGAAAVGNTVSWPAITGATGYILTLYANGQVIPLWEAFSATSSLALAGWPTPGAGAELTVTALAGPDERTVASLAGPRYLQLPPAAGWATRWSSRIWSLPP